MEPTFKILSQEAFPENINLLLEINLWGITYLVTSGDCVCLAIISYHFPADTGFERAAVFIKQSVAAQNILQQNFATVTITYAYPAAMLVPNALMAGADQKKLLELVYGEVNEAYIRTEFSYRQQLHTIYAVPKPVDAVISYLFSSAVIRHQFGMLSDMLPVNGSYLYCIFGNNQFTAQLTKTGKLQAIQCFNFKTPEDVAFYLLQLCDNYDMPVSEVLLQLGGMINTGSALYNELYKYFLQTALLPLPDAFSYPEDISQVPAHYFSHLFQMAVCG